MTITEKMYEVAKRGGLKKSHLKWIKDDLFPTKRKSSLFLTIMISDKPDAVEFVGKKNATGLGFTMDEHEARKMFKDWDWFVGKYKFYNDLE